MTIGNSEVKTYRPGDPEFDEIAKQCIPIERIRKDNYQTSKGIMAELDPKAIHSNRRKEKMD